MMEEKTVQTDQGVANGQTKCPKCGATDISLNSKNGKLRCNFCRFEFEAEQTQGWEEDITKLEGEVIGSGFKNIDQEANSMVTIKCSSCGAEVVIDTNETTQARCHWCRNILSINEQIPNGAVPDMVLPFQLSKKEAETTIANYVGKRKFFAHPTFKKEFTTANIMGFYLPYAIVDVNAHSTLSGEGEEKVAEYTRMDGDKKETYYDADVYQVKREFDLTIKGLTVESSSDKLDAQSKTKTNNIINAIMPFDTENCVKWDSNYLRGFSSEKRDTNIDTLREIVDKQSQDIARFAANKTIEQYDRGVRWDHEKLEVKGEQWKTAYLPVWIYSYLQKKGNNSLLHYVAVNARTKETVGSVPINKTKLFLISFLIEIFSGFAKFYVDTVTDTDWTWLLLTSGFLFYWYIYAKYRNSSARHSHESETENDMANLDTEDVFIKKETGLTNAFMDGANNKSITNQFATTERSYKKAVEAEEYVEQNQ